MPWHCSIFGPNELLHSNVSASWNMGCQLRSFWNVWKLPLVIQSLSICKNLLSRTYSANFCSKNLIWWDIWSFVLLLFWDYFFGWIDRARPFSVGGVVFSPLRFDRVFRWRSLQKAVPLLATQVRNHRNKGWTEKFEEWKAWEKITSPPRKLIN